MANKQESFLKNIGILTLSNLSSKVLVFFLVPLYTSVLSTSEYGAYDLVTTTISLLFPILTLNIADAVMRFMLDKQCDKGLVASIGFKYSLFGVSIGSLVLFCVCKMDFFEGIEGLEVVIILYYCFYVLYQYLIQFAKGLDLVMDMGIAGIIGTIIMIGSNIFFLLIWKSGVKGFFIANMLSQAVPAVYLFFRLHLQEYLCSCSKNKKIEKEMLYYCIPLIATSVGWWINSSSDKYVVTFLCGVAANGILSVAYKIPTILNTLQGILIQAWQITAIKEYGEKDTAKFYGKTFIVINLLMCMACSWLIILTKPLARLLYANDFYQAWQYVPFLLVSSVLNSASGLLGPILSAQKNSKAMMWSSVIGAGTNVIMNIAFVYFIGIQGATIATVICSVIIYVIRKKAVGKDIHIDNYAIVVITWCLLCLQAAVESYISLYLIEMLLMVILLIINMTFEKELIVVIKDAFCYRKGK